MKSLPAPRLLIVNNMPSRYRTSPFSTLCRRWEQSTGGSAHVAFQVRRDPRRRGEWFFTPDDELGFPHTFLSEKSWATGRATVYPLKPGFGLLSKFQPTHIFAAGWDSPVSLACAAYARARRRQLVLWVESNESTSQSSSRAVASLKRLVLESAMGVVVPTQQSLEFVRSISGHELSVAMLPNPVSLKRLGDRESSEKRIVFVGELSRRKGFDTFVEACAIGAADGWTGAAWGDDSEGLAGTAPPNCVVSPAIALEKLLDQVRTSDVWTIPSRRDPAPLTFSEALALGLRVSVSDGIAYRDLAVSVSGADVHAASDAQDLLESAGRLVRGPRPNRAAAVAVNEESWAEGVTALLLDEPEST